MQNSEEIFSQVETLKNNWKYEEALDLLKKLEEKSGNFASNQLLNLHFQFGSIYFELYQWDKSLKYLNLAYKLGQKLKNKKKLIEVLILKSWILRAMHRTEDALNMAIEIDEIFRTIEEPLSEELKLLLGYIYNNKAGCYLSLGNIGLAIKNLDDSLEIAKELKDLRLEMLVIKGFKFVHDMKGEYGKSFTITQDYLELANQLSDKKEIIGAHNSLGLSFIDKGDFKEAIHHLEIALGFCKEIKSWKTFIVLSSLFTAYIESDNLEKARICDKEMREYYNRYKSEFNKTILLFQEAELLKRGEPKDFEKAELILRKIANNKQVYSFLRFSGLVYLCDLLLNKLRKTNDLKLLDEIQHFINDIEYLADQNELYAIKVESLLFRARIKLLTFEFDEAKNLLKKALDITFQYNQPELENRIRKAEDNLTKDFITWENLKKNRANIAECMDLARLDEQIQVLLKKRSYFRAITKEKSPK